MHTTADNGVTKLEIAVDHWSFSDHFQDYAEQVQFARTKLLHIFNGDPQKCTYF